MKQFTWQENCQKMPKDVKILWKHSSVTVVWHTSRKMTNITGRMLFDHNTSVAKWRNNCDLTQDQTKKNKVTLSLMDISRWQKYIQSQPWTFQELLSKSKLLLTSTDSQGEELSFKSELGLPHVTSLCLCMGNKKGLQLLTISTPE